MLLFSFAFATEPVRLLWTGGNGGIGSGTYNFELHERLHSEGRLTGIEAVHGWLAYGDWLFSAQTQKVADTVALLEAAPACELAGTVTALRTPSEELVVLGELPSYTADWEGLRVPLQRWTCTADGTEGVLYGPYDAAPPETWVVTDWEFRRGLALQTEDEKLQSVGIPNREGTRLFGLLDQVTTMGDVLYFDAGDFVDGVSSVRNDGLSLHRPTAFAMLRRLDPAGLAPGANELAGGAKLFLSEAGELPYIASNWRSTDPSLTLPTHRIVESRGTKVAIVAALDPALVPEIPELAAEGISLDDPVKATQEVIDTLPDVDLVLLLTTASSDVTDALQARLKGVDLILGDVHSQASGITSQSWTFGPSGTRRPPILPARGPTAAAVTLNEDGQLDRLTLTPLAVTGTLSPDPESLAKVSTVRAQEYPTLDRPLLPAPPEYPLEVLDDALWSKVVCEAVQDQTRADLVLLPTLPPGRSSPGATTALIAGDWLATGDHVELHSVPGVQLRRLLDQLYGNVPVHCGAALGVKFPKARGRPLEDERLYRVVTTDRLRESSEVGALLQGARSKRKFDLPGFHGLKDENDDPHTLRSLTLESLDTLGKAHGDELITTLVARSPSDKPPLWLLRVREASLAVEGFQGADDPAYAEVPETLATSPSSFTLGSGLDAALDYSSARFNWDLRARSVLTRLTTDGETQETADDVKLSMSTNLPGIATPPVGNLTFSPYAEGMLDTEWTPGEDASQRQLDASITVGLASKRRNVLRVFRLGGIANQDLAVPGKQPEFGGRLEVQTRVGFGPGMAWTNQLDGFVFANTQDQDASDLRFKTQLDSRVALPLARWLSIAVYGRGFAFQGRVPETSAVRWSGSLGGALDLSGAFQLGG